LDLGLQHAQRHSRGGMRSNARAQTVRYFITYFPAITTSKRNKRQRDVFPSETTIHENFQHMKFCRKLPVIGIIIGKSCTIRDFQQIHWKTIKCPHIIHAYNFFSSRVFVDNKSPIELILVDHRAANNTGKHRSTQESRVAFKPQCHSWSSRQASKEYRRSFTQRTQPLCLVGKLCLSSRKINTE